MGSCKECRWWRRDQNIHPKSDTFGACGIVDYTYNIRDKDGDPNVLAIIPANYDSSWLMTQGEFGCVLFQQKEAN